MIANVATSQNWRKAFDLSVSEGLSENLSEIFNFFDLRNSGIYANTEGAI
jgi:hypothetical protein